MLFFISLLSPFCGIVFASILIKNTESTHKTNKNTISSTENFNIEKKNITTLINSINFVLLFRSFFFFSLALFFIFSHDLFTILIKCKVREKEIIYEFIINSVIDLSSFFSQ